MSHALLPDLDFIALLRARAYSVADWEEIWALESADPAPAQELPATRPLAAVQPVCLPGARAVQQPVAGAPSGALRPPFPEVIDSTIIAAFRSCPQKFFLEFIEHWKGKDRNVHLHAGAAYARGLEVARRSFYEDGKPAGDAVALGLAALLQAYGDFQCPEDSAKSASRTAGALEFHFDRYPLGADKAVPLDLPDGKKAIEFGGVEALTLLHPVTGNPLQYSWRMDMAIGYDGMRLGMDDKTTSQLGASWPKQWDLRSQFTAYTWGAEVGAYKLNLQGFLVRGISILKTKYDTLEAITYRPAWQIARWQKQVERDIARMLACWTEGYWDYSLDHACTEYGGCQFRNACLMPEPAPLLEQQFMRRRWDPVRREEVVLVQKEDGTWS